MTIIRTRRLMLRPLRPQDAEAIAALANNIAIAAMVARLPHPYTVADAHAFLARAGAGEGTPFGIIAPDGRLVGVAGHGPRPSGAGFQIGYWIGEPYWGRGYATEAARAVRDDAFESRALPALHVDCRVENHASRRVIEKLGFRRTGRGEQHILALDRVVPVDEFVLDRADWDSARCAEVIDL